MNPTHRNRVVSPRDIALAVLVLLVGAGVGALIGNALGRPPTARASLYVSPNAPKQIASGADAEALRDSYVAVLGRDPAIRSALRIGRPLGGSVRSIEKSALMEFRARGGSRTVAMGHLNDAVDVVKAGGSLVPADAVRMIRTTSSQADDGTWSVRGAFVVLAPSATSGTDAQSAVRLAANYSGLIPSSTAVRVAAAQAAGLQPGALDGKIGASNPFNTSQIELAITLPEAAQARAAVLGVVKVLTRDFEDVGFLAEPLDISNLPVTPKASSPIGSGTGALLGFLAAIAALAAGWLMRARRARRVSDVDVAGATGLPIFAVPDTALEVNGYRPAPGSSASVYPLSPGAELCAPGLRTLLTASEYATATGPVGAARLIAASGGTLGCALSEDVWDAVARELRTPAAEDSNLSGLIVIVPSGS